MTHGNVRRTLNVIRFSIGSVCSAMYASDPSIRITHPDLSIRITGCRERSDICLTPIAHGESRFMVLYPLRLPCFHCSVRCRRFYYFTPLLWLNITKLINHNHCDCFPTVVSTSVVLFFNRNLILYSIISNTNIIYERVFCNEEI